MGWTLFACFGYTKKRKRPKRPSYLGSKITRRTRARGYQPLKSDEDSRELDVSEPLGNQREKLKAEKKARIQKKVRFNLDVVTYEPLSSYHDEHEDTDSDGNDEGKENNEPAPKKACVIYAPVAVSNSMLKLPLISSNHRYNNCYDGEDEYEDAGDEDDDHITDDEDMDEDERANEDSDDGCTTDRKKLYYEEIMDEELGDSSSMPLIGSATNARLRSHYILPVLNPIENLSQWKALKNKNSKMLKS
ncbi:uncharacterized protein LOC130809795 isoform X2 [Amaranthus tricolor]|uniref:uncharacterized protein LOC130809795 isoform X2 n=1 Tax=Amaranthus tricolor TaxID=29722 RepID=UPI00258795B8|nr:uncharacterized protein LOC130809795 isoform X2 [Amaranthus tricolor]